MLEAVCFWISLEDFMILLCYYGLFSRHWDLFLMPAVAGHCLGCLGMDSGFLDIHNKDLMGSCEELWGLKDLWEERHLLKSAINGCAGCLLTTASSQEGGNEVWNQAGTLLPSVILLPR